MAAAVIGMARITGQIIDRREVSQVGAFDHMTDEQLVEEAKRRSAELGITLDASQLLPKAGETEHLPKPKIVKAIRKKCGRQG